MVGEVEGRVGPEQARELCVFGPSGDERSPVAAESADLVLADWRRNQHAAGNWIAVELNPSRQRPAGRRVIPRAWHASLLQGELETVRGEREHHLLGLAKGVAEQDRSDPAVKRQPAPSSNRFHRRIGVAEAKVRPAVRAFEDQDVGFRDKRRRYAAGLAQLDVAGVEHGSTVMLDVQLGRAEHVPGRIQRDPPVAAPHRLAEAQHSPAARPSCFWDEREGLRRQQRLFVAARVVGMRVRDEGEAAHDQGVKPKAVARQRDPAIPDDLSRQSRTSSPFANRSAGTATPTAA